MKKKNIKLGILVLSLVILITSVSYAYYSVFFQDTRTSDNKGNTNLKTCSIAEATIIDNIEDSVGSFSESNIYPGHKEVASFKVTASGGINSTSSFKFMYDVTENGLGNGNVKVSVYKSKEEIKVTHNYFNCEKTTKTIDNETRFYEECVEKELGDLLEETILTGGEETIDIGKDTIVVKNESGETRYYYVVIEFLNKENQNDFMNRALNGKVSIELATEKTKYKESILNGMDPVLKDELIPVIIESDGVVKKADESDEWYNYETQQWANAIILKDENETFCPGDVIEEDKIESYFVWIPKYRYQLWDLGNYGGLTSIDNSKVHTIPLIFGDYNTSDEVDGECTTPMTSGNPGNCKVGDYMTHPAFISIPSTGFWVGKFETSKSNTNADNSRNPDGVQIKPNVVSWRNIQAANAFYTTYDYKRNLDSHMMKNTEWGAVAYLQHSKYGGEHKIRNNNNPIYTGYAAAQEPTCGYTNDNRDCNRYGTTTDITLPYNTETGYLASTTGNISGIYDMSGGSSELVMTVMTDKNRNPLSGRNASLNSGFTGGYGEGGSLASGYAWPNPEYYETYGYSNNPLDYTNYTRRRLGDATGEMGPIKSIVYANNIEQFINSWYSGHSTFIDISNPWLARGGVYNNGSNSGVFAFFKMQGSENAFCGFRVVLTPSTTV